jgi:hypothetical protein
LKLDRGLGQEGQAGQGLVDLDLGLGQEDLEGLDLECDTLEDPEGTFACNIVYEDSEA